MATDEEDIVYQKAARYCSYQERTEKEVQKKLQIWGIDKKKEEHIIQTLKTNFFLDEERYVEAFIRGKFVGKKWGKRKLLAVLTKKGLDQALIQKGLATIGTKDYLQSLWDVAGRKRQFLAEATPMEKKQKLTNYLLQKGYEPDLVIQTVQQIIAQ